MASAKNEAKIQFTAETGEFNKSIKEANNELKGLRAEAKLNEAQMKLTGTSVDGLKDKQQNLQQQLEATQDKTAALSEKLEIAKRIYGENSDEAAKLRVELAKNQTSELNLQKAINDCSDELKDAEKAMDGAGDEADELGDKVDKAGKEAKNSQGNFTIMKGALAGLVADGISWTIGKLKDLAKEFINTSRGAAEFADNILTESTVTGISADKLQAYSYAAELVDVSVDTLTKSMAKNIKSMDSARDGSEAAVEAYKQLGISVVDSNGALRDSETVYWEAIEALGKIENDTERDAVAMQIFGKSAQDLNPLIQAGADKLNALAQEAQESGYILSGDTLNSLGELDDQFQRMNVKLEATRNQLGVQLMPIVSSVVTLITEKGIPALQTTGEKMVEVYNWASQHKQLLAAIATIIGIVTIAIGAYNVAQGIKTAMDAAGVTTVWGLAAAETASAAATIAATAPFLLIVAAIAAVIAIIVICVRHWDEIKNAAGNAANWIKNAWSTVASWFDTHVIQPIVNLWNKLKTAVQIAVELVRAIVLAKFLAVKSAIIDPVVEAKDKVGEVVDKIKSFFSNMKLSLPKIKLPHFKLTGTLSLNPPSVPKLAIDWYAKGGILTAPTIFGAMNGRLLGGGEAGYEAVLPIDNLQGYISAAIDRELATFNLSPVVDAIEDLAERPNVLEVNGRQFALATAGDSDRVSGERLALKTRGVAI